MRWYNEFVEVYVVGMGEIYLKISEPDFNDINLYRLTYGIALTPKKMIETFDDEVYEDFISCWLLGHIKNNYVAIERDYFDVENMGGAGDKGRDVVAYLSDDKRNGEWDNYQCKHYHNLLAPTMIYKEIGKLLYYTYIGDFTCPRYYYFVAPKGVGPKLSDLLKKPLELRNELIKHWDSHCKSKITKSTEIELSGDFCKYVNSFNFSIFRAIGTHTMLKDIEKTKYYSAFFGGGFKNPRPLDREPDEKISLSEAVYTSELFQAYGDHLKKTVNSIENLKDSPKIVEHFKRQREDFYKAESLKDYAKESLPSHKVFEDLQECVYDAVIDIVDDDYIDGYKCVKETLKEVVKVDLTSNILNQVTRPADRKGICHQLINDRRIKWVKYDE